MSSWNGVVFCLLLALTGGCADSSTRTAGLKPIPSSLPRTPQAPRAPVPATRPSSPVTLQPVTQLPVVAAGVEPAPTPALEWISLETWCRTNGATRWGRFQTATNQGAEVTAPSGMLRLTAGSQQAQWNGLTLWLGFPPVASNGLFLVHSVDLGKNLGPLVESGAPPGPTNRVVVIDPGHGGINAGTRSILGNRFEKDYTLDWALRLQPLLETNGWRVVLTRTNDVDLSLADRVAVADRVQASLFISLHFNSAFPRQDQAGLETFCLTPAGLPSTLTRDFEDDPGKVFPNNEFDAPNLRLALAVHRALLEVSGTADRGVKRARFMGVLRTQSRPAILIEAGYLSNPEEAGRIGRPEHRQQLAEAVSRALPRGGAETLAAAHTP